MISFPNARFYVPKDHVALFASDITSPRQSTDPNARVPTVTFGFTTKGKAEFQSVTANVAHRGALVSAPGQTFNQHFAVALDTTLLTVPQIDFKTYPDGIRGAGGDIAGGLTAQSARDLVTELRLGALPLNLRLIAETPLPVHR